MDEMIEQCQEPGGCRTLHLLQGATARMMGLDVLDDETNRHPISHVKDELDCESLWDHRYMTLAMTGALAQAINTAIVVWVQHPTSPSKLVVHRESQVGFLVSDRLHASPRLHRTFCGRDVMGTRCWIWTITTEISDISVVMVCI